MATSKVVPMAATKMKSAQILKPGAPFQIVERAIPEPGPGEVRIRVNACGICHSDVLVKEGIFPSTQYPRVPGHEVAGIVDEVGDGVATWKTGQRVGVGWHGGHDGTCRECRRGDFINCRNGKISGVSYDGQEVVVVGDPESVDVDLALFHVRTEGDAFDLGGNVAGGYAVAGKQVNDIEKQALTNNIGQCRGRAHVADVGCAVQVDLEKLLDHGVAAIGAVSRPSRPFKLFPALSQ